VFVDQQIMTYSPRLKTGALLPEFPAVTDIRLTDDVTEEKVRSRTIAFQLSGRSIPSDDRNLTRIANWV